jgi:hypothetical protein
MSALHKFSTWVFMSIIVFGGTVGTIGLIGVYANSRRVDGDVFLLFGFGGIAALSALAAGIVLASMRGRVFSKLTVDTTTFLILLLMLGLIFRAFMMGVVGTGNIFDTGLTKFLQVAAPIGSVFVWWSAIRALQITSKQNAVGVEIDVAVDTSLHKAGSPQDHQ